MGVATPFGAIATGRPAGSPRWIMQHPPPGAVTLDMEPAASNLP